jgi:hypothetical protein
MKRIIQRLKQNKHRTRLFLICFFHTLFLIFISLWLVNQHMVLGDERILFQVTAGIKKIILGIENKPDPKDYIFINNSYDNMLIERLDEEGFPMGNQPITDRRKLAMFFDRLNKRPDNYKYIVCDVFFKDSSQYDSVFISKISRTKNIIIPYHINDSGKADLPFLNINHGLADYRSVQYVFMKYALTSNDTMKSLPLKMYEDITGKKFINKGILSFVDGKPSFNTIVIDFKLRYYELLDRNAERMYNIVNLGELLRMNDSVFYKAVNNKIILIGDYYEKDIHQTLFGKMSGTLILLNVYFTLLNGENLISIGLFLILFLGFFLISTELFSDKSLGERKLIAKYTQKKFGKFILKYLSYVLYLTILSILTYLIFNIHLNILIIAIYLKSVDSLLKYFKERKNKKTKINKEEKNEN